MHSRQRIYCRRDSTTKGDTVARREMSTDPRAVKTRATLIDATVELLKTQRAESLSVSQIVKEGSLSRQVFYEHFEDRDALLFAAAEKIIAPSVDWAREHSESSAPGESIEGLFAALEPHQDSLRNLLDGPVHWKLHSYCVSQVLPFVEARVLRQQEKSGAELTNEQVEYTAQVLACGVVDQMMRAIRDGRTGAETARRIMLVIEAIASV